MNTNPLADESVTIFTFSSLCVFLTNEHIYTPTATTTTISSVCPKCGIIAKTRKISCCGRSGSWFGNCASAGNAKLHHTWYEGIRACKARAQSKIAFAQQANARRQKRNSSSSNDVDMINLKAVATVNTSNNILMNSVTSTSASTLITVQGCENLLKFAAQIILLLMII